MSNNNYGYYNNRYGGSIERFPNPLVDLNAFIKSIHEENKKFGQVFCVRNKKFKHWIEEVTLRSCYKKGGGCSIM